MIYAELREEEDDLTIYAYLSTILLFVHLLLLGLTIGLMGLDETNLHVLMASGSPKEQFHAETVFGLLSRGKHWVLGELFTLLLLLFCFCSQCSEPTKFFYPSGYNNNKQMDGKCAPVLTNIRYLCWQFRSLVTLLLGNVIVNETLPVVLDSELGGGVVAILISTLLIVIFGE